MSTNNSSYLLDLLKWNVHSLWYTYYSSRWYKILQPYKELHIHSHQGTRVIYSYKTMNCVSYHVMFEDTVIIDISNVQDLESQTSNYRYTGWKTPKISAPNSLYPIIVCHSNIKNQIWMNEEDQLKRKLLFTIFNYDQIMILKQLFRNA